MINPQTLKGFRDFLPQDARKRQYVLDILRNTFESFGYEPLETPALEYEEVLTGKYGEEGDKLMYKFEDQGGRKVALRYDQTVPLARVTAQYQNDIPLPFKRYQVQNVYRAENTQKGRYREFLQVDVDNVGSESALADAEIIAIAIKGYEALGFSNIRVLINDRNIFTSFSNNLFDEKDLPAVIRTLDKLEKIGKEKVLDELTNLRLSTEQATNLLQLINEQEPTEYLNNVLSYLKEMKLDEKVEFSPALARGLDYYTGLIIEVKCDEYPSGSLGGGGRYDKLIGIFMNKDIPAVGFSFGFDRTLEAMEVLKLFPLEVSGTKALVTVFSKELSSQSLYLATYLREHGINVDVFNDDLPLDKQLKYADKKNIPYVIILGEDEIKKDTVILKDMNTGEQTELNPHDLPNELK